LVICPKPRFNDDKGEDPGSAYGRKLEESAMSWSVAIGCGKENYAAHGDPNKLS